MVKSAIPFCHSPLFAPIYSNPIPAGCRSPAILRTFNAQAAGSNPAGSCRKAVSVAQLVEQDMKAGRLLPRRGKELGRCRRAVLLRLLIPVTAQIFTLVNFITHRHFDGLNLDFLMPQDHSYLRRNESVRHFSLAAGPGPHATAVCPTATNPFRPTLPIRNGP